MLTKLVLVFLLTALCISQKCLNHQGQSVSWLLVINAPKSVTSGYLYFDSTFANDKFLYYKQGSDSPGNPIFNTLSSFNSQNVKLLAWNDQPPNGGSSSSSKAHSKSIIAFDYIAYDGAIVVHSLPQFPQVVNNVVNVTIGQSQTVYGQHFLCISTPSAITIDVLTKSSIINPNIYANTIDKSHSMKSLNLFEYSQFTIGATPFKVIYKNGNLNGSIFEDGLTKLLKSDILAQTWGRPIQTPWCGDANTPYKVGNAEGVAFDSQIAWKQTNDHSKWAIATFQNSPFSCFGDMNRMTSQWKRGGIFYCLSHPNLKNAMRNLIKVPSVCA